MRYGDESRCAVLILYYLGGLRLKEIAHVLDCPIGMVKWRLHYGRELLRVWLAGEAAPRARSRLEAVHDPA
ncbi:MAG TPA: sigma factor-like helix-turn-helix DNA-binding protein [Anaerolineae bacterium]|nr:sigma factor-like helix-turn-helix DNA-binding protein [Anaerolineae bacterium]